VVAIPIPNYNFTMSNTLTVSEVMETYVYTNGIYVSYSFSHLDVGYDVSSAVMYQIGNDYCYGSSTTTYNYGNYIGTSTTTLSI
jgi:hypothetical protein